MEAFETIWKRAAARKGGDGELEALLPESKTPAELRAIPDDRWLAELSKRIFQAGFVWKVIESKWEGFEAAFAGFDPARLAKLSDGDIGRLLTDERIVRNGQKILAVRDNAVFFSELAREHGSAAAFFADWPDADFVGLLEVMQARGSRLGGFTGQVFLRFMGKDSFIINDDVSAALIAAGVVKRKPTSKRDLAAVQEAFNTWREQSGRSMAHISRTLACSVGD
jgi:3-methyladenine DNA glycosylase Tag